MESASAATSLPRAVALVLVGGLFALPVELLLRLLGLQRSGVATTILACAAMLLVAWIADRRER